MNEDEIKELYSSAWKQWGASSQIDMLIEEMSELIQALLKSRRNGVLFTYEAVEEFVDVEICMEQVKNKLIEFDEDNLLVTIRNQKLERLKNRFVSDSECNYDERDDL